MNPSLFNELIGRKTYPCWEHNCQKRVYVHWTDCTAFCNMVCIWLLGGISVIVYAKDVYHRQKNSWSKNYQIYLYIKVFFGICKEEMITCLKRSKGLTVVDFDWLVTTRWLRASVLWMTCFVIKLLFIRFCNHCKVRFLASQIYSRFGQVF